MTFFWSSDQAWCFAECGLWDRLCDFGRRQAIQRNEKPCREARETFRGIGLDWSLAPSLAIESVIFFLVGGLEHEFYFAIWE